MRSLRSLVASFVFIILSGQPASSQYPCPTMFFTCWDCGFGVNICGACGIDSIFITGDPGQTAAFCRVGGYGSCLYCYTSCDLCQLTLFKGVTRCAEGPFESFSAYFCCDTCGPIGEQE